VGLHRDVEGGGCLGSRCRGGLSSHNGGGTWTQQHWCNCSGKCDAAARSQQHAV
jgi:hypothetical protein